MDSDTGKTVKATLKLQLDTGDAKREAAATKKELDAITKAATLSDWRMGNRVERNKMHAEERKMMQEERQFWKERDKQEYDYTMAKRRSLAYMVQQGKIARRQEANEAKRAAREEEREMQARGSLAQQSLALMGAGGFAGKVGKYQAYGQLLESAGMSGVGSLMMRSAPWIAAASSAIDIGASVGRVNANIFADEEQKRSMYFQNMPVVGYALRKINENRGLPEAVAEAEFGIQKDRIRSSVDAEKFSFAMDYGTRSGQYQARAEAYGGYQVAGLPTADRGTSAASKVLFQEQLRLQKSTQALAKSEVELTAARNISILAGNRVSLSAGIFNSEVKRAGYLEDVSNLGEVNSLGSKERIAAKLKAAGISENAISTVEQYRQEYVKSLEVQQQANAGVVGAGMSRNMAAIAVGADTLANRQARTAYAEERAQAIGGMQMGGRMKALQMLSIIKNNPDMLDKIGDENVSAAASIAPRFIADLKEKQGKEFIEEHGEVFNDPALQGDYQYRVDSSREAERKLRGGLAFQEVTAERGQAEAMANTYAASFVDLFMNALEAKVAIKVKEIIAQAETGAARVVPGAPHQ